MLFIVWNQKELNWTELKPSHNIWPIFIFKISTEENSDPY